MIMTTIQYFILSSAWLTVGIYAQFDSRGCWGGGGGDGGEAGK